MTLKQVEKFIDSLDYENHEDRKTLEALRNRIQAIQYVYEEPAHTELLRMLSDNIQD